METNYPRQSLNNRQIGPHSLGTLIEWKRHDIECLSHKIVHLSHLLGILIEWKPCKNEELRIKNEE